MLAPSLLPWYVHSWKHLSPLWTAGHKHRYSLLSAIKQMAVLNPNEVVHLPGGRCFHTPPLFHNSSVINLVYSQEHERGSWQWQLIYYHQHAPALLLLPRAHGDHAWEATWWTQEPWYSLHLQKCGVFVFLFFFSSSCFQVKQKNTGLILKRTRYEAWLLLISYVTGQGQILWALVPCL